MIAFRTIDLRNDFKKISDIINSGEKVLIARPHNENLVVLSEKEYNELEKARHNAEHVAKTEKSLKDLAEGKTVTFKVDELAYAFANLGMVVDRSGCVQQCCAYLLGSDGCHPGSYPIAAHQLAG